MERPSRSCETFANEYLQAALAGDEDACLGMARECATDLEGLHELYVGLIQPTQYEVGAMWERGRISVATEHLATATNTFVALTAYAPFARVTAGGPRAVVACTQGEYHELGARLTADLLECDGWDVTFLGTTMPVRDLLEAIGERKPQVVGLSAALTQHLGSVKTLVASIRGEFGGSCPPIVVGGNAFRDSAEVWQLVDADAYAPDASRAVELLTQFRG